MATAICAPSPASADDDVVARIDSTTLINRNRIVLYDFDHESLHRDEIDAMGMEVITDATVTLYESGDHTEYAIDVSDSAGKTITADYRGIGYDPETGREISCLMKLSNIKLSAASWLQSMEDAYGMPAPVKPEGDDDPNHNAKATYLSVPSIRLAANFSGGYWMMGVEECVVEMTFYYGDDHADTVPLDDAYVTIRSLDVDGWDWLPDAYGRTYGNEAVMPLNALKNVYLTPDSSIERWGDLWGFNTDPDKDPTYPLAKNDDGSLSLANYFTNKEPASDVFEDPDYAVTFYGVRDGATGKSSDTFQFKMLDTQGWTHNMPYFGTISAVEPPAPVKSVDDTHLYNRLDEVQWKVVQEVPGRDEMLGDYTSFTFWDDIPAECSVDDLHVYREDGSEVKSGTKAISGQRVEYAFDLSAEDIYDQVYTFVVSSTIQTLPSADAKVIKNNGWTSFSGFDQKTNEAEIHLYDPESLNPPTKAVLDNEHPHLRGDTVTWVVDQQIPPAEKIEDWYASVVFEDVFSEELSVSNVRVIHDEIDASGNSARVDVTSKGTLTIDGNRVRFSFDRDYLRSPEFYSPLSSDGVTSIQATYHFEIDTVIERYPSDGTLQIPNQASATFDDKTTLYTNIAYVDLPTPEKPQNPVKYVDDSREYRLGDEVIWKVSQSVPARWAANDDFTYAWIDDDIRDETEVKWARVMSDTGEDVTSKGTLSLDGQHVHFDFDLDAMGVGFYHHTYTLETYCEVVDYPDDNSLLVDNWARTEFGMPQDTFEYHDGKLTLDTNTVHIKLTTPEYAVEKHADHTGGLTGVGGGFEYLSHDQNPDSFSRVHYIGTMQNLVEGTRGKSTTIEDTLPAGLELIPESVKFTWEDGTTDGIEVNASDNVITVTLSELDGRKPILFEYDCLTTDEGNGREVVNTVHAWALNIDSGFDGNVGQHATDDGEIYINDPTPVVTKTVSESAVQNDDYQDAGDQQREEYRVGDEITYTVTIENTTLGTFARNVMLIDDDMPAGLELVSSVSVTGLDDGMNKHVFYPIAGETDSVHGEGETRTVQHTLSMVENAEEGTWGWELGLNYLAYGRPVTVSWTVRPTDEVNGWEIRNQARATAENQPNDTFSSETPCIWVNTPEFQLDKHVSKTDKAYHVGDVAAYDVELFGLKTPGTLARQTTLEDVFRTEGTAIVENSFVITDGAEEAADIRNQVDLNRNVGDQLWKIEVDQIYEDGGYWVCTDNFRYVWSDGTLTEVSSERNPVGADAHDYLKIHYEAAINDMALQNDLVVNDAIVDSLEGYPVTDTEDVTVIGAPSDPIEPEEPGAPEDPTQDDPSLPTDNPLKGLDQTGDAIMSWLMRNWFCLPLALVACIAACWGIPRLARTGKDDE